mmetsp:Transcript_38102/g.118465  ORF Transcript_38102/g.118465 Transcript_38102/m.118465 type:complete len:348 (-) Transcript_38102:520-1563(-)
MLSRQPTSMILTPSLVIDRFTLIRSMRTFSQELPTFSPILFWFERNQVCMVVSALSISFAAQSLMHSASRSLVEMSTNFNVLLTLNTSASSRADCRKKLELHSLSVARCVLLSKAFMSLGATSGWTVGGGMLRSEKLSSSSESSSRCARWTIHTIQVRRLSLPGSSARQSFAVVVAMIFSISFASGSCTSRVHLKVTLPLALDPVIRKVVEAATSVSEPERRPVVGSNVNPAGNVPSTAKSVQAPPSTVGTQSTESPTVYCGLSVPYSKPVGAGGNTPKRTVAVVEPLAFVAVMVYVLAGQGPLGAPLILPVSGSKVRPAGSGESMEKLVAVPPPRVGSRFTCWPTS